MIQKIRNLFKKTDKVNLSEYTGIADFFQRASIDDQKKVIREAAMKSNEDQLRIFERAKSRTVAR